jgi:hypothetical protein
MATGTRALTLKLIADIDDFNKNLNKGSTEVEGFGGKIEKFGKMAAVAFAAAAAAAVAYAGKLAIDGVKAAIEDEAAQVRLAGALERATGATRDQIAAVEQQITKTALATGVADDQLRPALARLAVSTGDTAKAQDLLNLALDVAQATGKPVETVANALGKAYDGNTASLGKLGIGLSAAELKTMSFTDVQGKLSELFGGAAAANAETFQGRMDRLKVAFDEAKETIGFALLPIIEKLVSFVVNQVVPNLQKFASAFDPIKEAIENNKESFQKLWAFIGDYVIPILTTLAGGALKVVGEIFGKIIDIIGFAIDKISAFVDAVRNMVNAVITAYNRLPLPNISLVGGGGGFATGGAPGAIGGGGGSNAAILSAVTGLAGVTSSMSGLSGAATGKGSTAANKAALAKLQSDAEKLGALVDQLTGTNQYASTFTSDSAAARAERAFQAQTVTVNFNGVVGDGESVKRSLIEMFNDSEARGTLGATAFAGL